MNWTPWRISVQEDGSGDLYEWITTMVVCTDHGARVAYYPVSFLADSVPEDPELQEKLLNIQYPWVVDGMRGLGCDHDVPPIPSFK